MNDIANCLVHKLIPQCATCKITINLAYPNEVRSHTLSLMLRSSRCCPDWVSGGGVEVGGVWGRRGVEVTVGEGTREGMSSFTHRHLILHREERGILRFTDQDY